MLYLVTDADIHLLGFLLELLNSSLVDATAFVDQMAGGRRLAGVDVTNDDNVDVSLLGTHGSQTEQPSPQINQHDKLSPIRYLSSMKFTENCTHESLFSVKIYFG